MRPWLGAAFLLAASLAAGGCELLPFFTPDPERCIEGSFRYSSCGVCAAGYRIEICGPDRTWAPEGATCSDNELDTDDDGFANERCYAEHPGDDCCGPQPDCDDEDPLRWPGNADFDGDGEDAYSCGGLDCDDDYGELNPANPDKDRDGRADDRCCPATEPECDCDDGDAARWTGHADLDGDGREAVSCGGNDCDDADPDRWTGRADLDQDDHAAATCGGDDCDDRDPERWTGHADLDGDGHVAKTCGGDDCDDDCETCFTDGDGTARRACGEARDHDCNGLVDELDGCPPQPPFADLAPVGYLPAAPSRDLFVVGHRAFLATEDGLLEVDVTAADDPVSVGRADTGDSHAVFLSGPDAFVASSMGVYRVDVSRPGRAAIVAGPWPTGDSRGLFVVGASIFVAAYDGVFLVDRRGVPRVASSLLTGDTSDSQAVFVIDNFALATRSADRGGFYTLVWTSDLALHLHDTAPGVGAARGLFASGGNSWVAACPDLVLSASNGPADVVRTYPTGCAEDVFVVGQVAYVVAETGLLVFDVTDPRGRTDSLGPFPVEEGHAVFVSGCEVFVAATDGLHVFSHGAACP